MATYLELLTNYLQIQVVQAILCIIISILAAKFADWMIRRILFRLVSHTSSTIDDKIIQILHRPIYYSILLAGLGISVQLFPLPEIIAFVLIGLFKTVAIIFWSFALFKSFMYFINWYSHPKQKSNIIKVHTLPIFDNVGKIIIFMLGVYFILVSWGVNVTGWLASTTIVAMVVALAAKDTVANLFAGFFIMADTPYKTGDYINLDGGERGWVKTIGLRSTRIMTRDDVEITLPNSLIANSKIINESGGGAEKERLRINISVAYGTDIDKVREILVELSKSSKNVCTIPDPCVRFRSFGDSGLIFQLLFWIEKPKDRGRIIDEINSKIYKKFNAEHIEIPFPQRTIHMQASDIKKITE